MSRLVDACYLVAAAAASPWLLRKKRDAWPERWGRTASLPARGPKPRLLIHAVSVGETNLLGPLIDRLAPHADLVIASTTDTGAARARALYADRATLVRYPLDASWAVRRFLDAVRPDAAALVELELWPNFAAECARRAIPLAILNGRLSDRSHNRYAMARPLLGRWFASLDFVAAQDQTYAQRFIRAGALPERVHVAGSMKWDSAPASTDVAGSDDLARELGIDRAMPLIVAGSTDPDEHALLHGATPPGAQLLCAPRKPEWFDGAARDLPGCVRRSAGPRPPGAPPADRFLLDTIGELRRAYALADVVVVGRSFGSLHGSDPMEPAALAKPVVIGPAVDDFRAVVADMLEDDAILQVGREALAPTLRRLLDDPAERADRAARARACVESHRGAAERHAALILDMLHRSRARAAQAAAP